MNWYLKYYLHYWYNYYSTNNDFYKNAALKVFAQLGQLIEEDENKPKQINVLDSSTGILKDDKPFKFDLSIMPDDVVSCIGKHLEDYLFLQNHQ